MLTAIGSGTGGHPAGTEEPINASWPPRPRAATYAVTPIRVRVRLQWPEGSEWVTGRAARWQGRCVWVLLWHQRVAPVQGVWVNAVDVRRELARRPRAKFSTVGGKA